MRNLRPVDVLAPPAAEKRRLLLVDDEPVVLKMFETALRRAGFEVDAFASGTSARAMLALRRYHALVTDKNMPDMDGVALAQLARASQPNLPIVMTTGHATPEVAKSLLNVVDVLFAKPVSLKVLVAGISSAILRRNELAEAARTSVAPVTLPAVAPVVILTADPSRAYQIARLLRDLGKTAEAVTGLDELSRLRDLSGLVLDAACVGPEDQRAIWRLLGRHEGLKVIVLGDDNARAVGLGASAQVPLSASLPTMRAALQQAFGSDPGRPLPAR